MIRTTTLSAAALLALTLLAPPAARAAGETCQGSPATIVGSDRSTPIVGTDGPDVIVSTGARVIDARGGDDLVCVVDDTTVLRLDAGTGDDLVDASAGYVRHAVLGSGADTYLGSQGSDQVWAGTRPRGGSGGTDTETDTIDTGDGQEADEVFSGERGSMNGDQVRVGVLAEVSWAGIPTTSSIVSSVRYGALTLDVRARDRVRIDNVTGVLTYAGAPPLAVPGFTDFTVRSRVRPTRLRLPRQRRRREAAPRLRQAEGAPRRHGRRGERAERERRARPPRRDDVPGGLPTRQRQRDPADRPDRPRPRSRSPHHAVGT